MLNITVKDVSAIENYFVKAQVRPALFVRFGWASTTRFFLRLGVGAIKVSTYFPNLLEERISEF